MLVRVTRGLVCWWYDGQHILLTSIWPPGAGHGDPSMGHQHGGGGPPLDSPALGLAARLRQGPGRAGGGPSLPRVLRCARRERMNTTRDGSDTIL